MRRQVIIAIIKFVILTGIFYAALALNVFRLGEKLSPSTKDYLETNVPSQDTTIEDEYLEIDTSIQAATGHGAAVTLDLDALCEKVGVCDKIVFNGTYTTTEKYSYTRIIGKILDFIQKNGDQDKNIKDVITKIEINKENGNRRGYATWDTIIFNLGSVQSNREFIELTTHEMGHITDLGYIQGISSKKDKSYTEFGKVVFRIDDLSLVFYKVSRDNETIRKAEAKKKDFCSGYGMSDPFEDFSECFNLYINHNILFRQMAKSNTALKKKYNFIASIFDGKYISSNSSELDLVKKDVTRRPRDTTKIAIN